MKVLLVTFKWYGGFHGSIERALKSLSVDVHTYYYLDVSGTPEKKSLLSRIGRKIRRTITPNNDENIYQLAKDLKPDLILIVKGESLGLANIQKIKKEMNIPIAVWWVDNPFVYAAMYPQVLEILKSVDATFIFDQYYVGLLREIGLKNVFYLPNAGDPILYKKIPLSSQQIQDYGAALSFIGTAYPERTSILRDLSSLNELIRVWGYGWEKGGLHDLGVKGKLTVTDRIIQVEEENVIYNATKINLNFHHNQCVNAPNQRVFNLPLAGAFQLVFRKPGIQQLLKEGQEMVYYDSLDEMRDKIIYYLRNAELREKIVMLGRNRVLAEHTYTHRMKSLLQSVENCRK